MGERQPKVSIGLPVYNGERYLPRAVESILAQTFADFELVICDNASTDGTADLCRAYAAADRRVRYHRNERNIGAAPNFNRTFELSVGRYFKWAAHDDCHAPTYLERCVGLLDARPGVVLCHTRAAVIDAAGARIPAYEPPAGERPDERPDGALTYADLYDPADRRLDSPRVAERLRAVLIETRWCFDMFGLCRADALRRTPLNLSFYGSDKVLLAALALAGPFVELDEELFHRRYHPQQSSKKSNAEQKVWMDTSADGRREWPPQVQCGLWLLRLVREADLPPWQRARCLLEVARWAGWITGVIYRDRHYRGLLYRAQHRARELVGAWLVGGRRGAADAPTPKIGKVQPRSGI